VKARSVKAAVDAERARRAALAARKTDAENDLLEFVDMFWRVVEPVTPLVKGWVLSAMADALMAVTDGHLTRVILNVPPGSMKSMLLNVFWPAWEWGPMNMPHLRYLSASYSSAIPERDNARLLRVITDPVYLRCWGDRFGVIRAGMTLVENDKTGWKRVISTSSGTTGHRGDRILCLPADAVITTDAGDMRIGDIVHERRNVRIAGWSGSAVEWQAIERYETNPPGAMVRIRYARGALTCTADHRVWVKGRGYVAAESIVPDDVLRCIVGGALVPTVSAVSGVDRLGFDGRPTYNLRVGPHHNYFADGVLVHNCDDLNDPNDVESPSVRAATVHWVREVMPDRLNNMQQSAIINVQQRTHEQDATGVLAEHGDNYTWISIPMEFDPLRLCRAALRWDEDGEVLQEWVDPRGVDADGKELAGLYEDERGNLKVTMGSPMAQVAGTLAWPERFPPDTVAALKKIKGPYAWCNPYEAPVLMADLTMRPIGEIREGDMVMGFTMDTAPKREGEKFSRRHLTHAQVKSISVSVRPVVKITLAGGEVIRCTADHRWYTGRPPNDPSHPLYAPAKVGRALLRVCPPRLPELTGDDLREAGWLCGFYDGEGSVTRNIRREGAKSTPLITITQGTGRNLHLCERLERALDRFGFAWNFKEGVRSDRKPGPNSDGTMQRTYWIKRNGLVTYQRFLHITQTMKWRDRLLEGGCNSRMIQAEERVLSIEPDGEETVYGLETTTGNYVVWGLASSNSGQYNQHPTVRGGAIIQRDWWQTWTARHYPSVGTVIVSLDTAIKESEASDYTACTVWGAFEGENGAPQVILLDAWRDRISLAETVAKSADTCFRWKADYLLIEDKARGHDASVEIQRHYANRTWETVLIKVNSNSGDKEARLRAISPLFSGDVRRDPVTGIDAWVGGMVWAPATEWAEDVINEVTSFPRGVHDDYVDSVSQSLSFMRRHGVVLRKAEHEHNEHEARKFRRTPGVPYAVGRQ
jgi:predicted phage terminase large subunit-like protein